MSVRYAQALARDNTPTFAGRGCTAYRAGQHFPSFAPTPSGSSSLSSATRRSVHHVPHHTPTGPSLALKRARSSREPAARTALQAAAGDRAFGTEETHEDAVRSPSNSAAHAGESESDLDPCTSESSHVSMHSGGGAVAVTQPAPRGAFAGMRKTLVDVAVIGLPAMFNSLYEPAQSMVEMWCIGHRGPLELAALLPGTQLLNMTAEISFSFSVMTTMYVASTLATGKGTMTVDHAASEDSAGDTEASRALATAVAAPLDMPLAAGLDAAQVRARKAVVARVVQTQMLCLTLLAAVATALLLLHIATLGVPLLGSSDPELTSRAALYCALRCLSVPLFMIASLGEGVYVGLQDTVTPLKIYSVSTAVILGGLLLFDCLAPQHLLSAAALSFVLGMAVNAVMVLRSLARAGLLPAWGAPLDLLPRAEILHMADLCLSYTLGVMARMVTYAVVASVVSTWSVLDTAAHKICYESLWMLSFFTEPAFTAANALMSRDMASGKRQARQLVGVVMCVSVAMALVLPCIGWYLLTGGMFSTDAALTALLHTLVLPLGLTVCCSSISYALEGILVGMGRTGYLKVVHISNSVLMVAYVACIVPYLNLGLAGIWYGLAGWHLLRIVEHTIFLCATQPFKDCPDDVAVSA